MEFFGELLALLKDTLSDTVTIDLKEKRKLLAPLLASIAIDKNNSSLNSPKLFYQWYEKGGINKETNEIPDQLLVDWCVDNELLESIINIAEKIIINQKVYILSNSLSLTPLFNKEVTHLTNINYESTLHIDKHLALVTGNILYNKQGDYFIRRFDFDDVQELLKNAHHDWLKKSFIGIRLIGMDQDQFHRDLVSKVTVSGFDFSNAVFKDVIIYSSSFRSCSFANSVFENVIFYHTTLYNCFTRNVQIIGFIDLVGCLFNDFVHIPNFLTIKALKNMYLDNKERYKHRRFHHVRPDYQTFIKFKTGGAIDEFFIELGFYFKYCFDHNYLSEADVLKAFPSRDLKYKAKIKEILQEISDKGFYEPSKKKSGTKVGGSRLA